MMVEQKLTKAERTKKTSLESFLRRLDWFEGSLTNSKVKGEHKQQESQTHYLGDVNKLYHFFTHITNLFSDLYQKINSEKNLRFQSLKEEYDEKIKLLNTHMSNVNDLRKDIETNFDNILICMEEEPFAKIMKKYGSSVDHIQKLFEDQKLDQFPVYEDIVENLRGMDKIHETLQLCLNQIARIFDNSSLSSSVSMSLLGDHGNTALNDEMKRTNDFRVCCLKCRLIHLAERLLLQY